jgi:hypothetical protein
LPFDPSDPPDDPPPGVTQVTLWRLAVRLVRDHVADEAAAPAVTGRRSPARVRCVTCADAWPCRLRRLAEHALVSLSRPVAPPSRNQAYLDWLRDSALRDNSDKKDNK